MLRRMMRAPALWTGRRRQHQQTSVVRWSAQRPLTRHGFRRRSTAGFIL